MGSNEAGLGNITAIEYGNRRIEYQPLDFSAAYAAIAPLASEALVFLNCGKTEDAIRSLSRARQMIEVASLFMCSIVTEEKDVK